MQMISAADIHVFYSVMMKFLSVYGCTSLTLHTHQHQQKLLLGELFLACDSEQSLTIHKLAL